MKTILRKSILFGLISLASTLFCAQTSMGAQKFNLQHHQGLLRQPASVMSDQKTIEFLNVDESNKKSEIAYTQFPVTQIQDLEVIKGILNQILDEINREFLTSKFPFKKDYFKSAKIAVNLIENIKTKENSNVKLMDMPEYKVIIDVLNSMRNNAFSPIEESVPVFSILSAIAKHTSKPIIAIDDLTNIKFPVVTASIDEEYTRPHLLSGNTKPCAYDGAKKGYGYKAGLKINCQGTILKLKFGAESYSGPFNSRIMRSLGYETPKIDFIKQLEMEYSKEFIKEFNSRKTTTAYLTLGNKIVYEKVGNNSKRNALDFVISMKLNDGRILTGTELRDFKLALYKFDKDEINTEMDSLISTVTFTAGSVVEDLEGIEVGPWRFDEPNRFSDTKLRQALILFAWFGNTDFPMNNNRLYLKKDANKNYFISPVYIDVGFGLGVSDRLSGMSSSDLEHMGDLMSSPIAEDPDSMAFSSKKKVALMMVPKTPNTMLDDLNYQDVVNGITQLCRLSENQISDALKAAGYDEIAAKKGTAKLIHRRSQLIRDFELESHFYTCIK